MSLVLLQYPTSTIFNSNSLKITWKDRIPISPKVTIICGIIFGLSFQFRYQIGISVFFFYLWCLLYGRMKISSGLLMTLSLLVTIGFSFFIDYWGYGEPTFSAWNYFYVDVIQGVPGKTLASPWYDYFRLSLLRGIPPISLIFIIGTLVFWWKYKTHPFTWATLPFMIVHQIFIHKELRYIFVIVLLAPIMTILAVQKFNFKKSNIMKYAMYFLVGVNTILLLVSSLKPANVAPTFYKKLATYKVKEFKYLGENPMTILGLNLNYYNRTNIDAIKAQKIPETAFSGYFVTTKGNDYFEFKKRFPTCEQKYITYPEWILSINISNWAKRSRIWALHHCK